MLFRSAGSVNRAHRPGLPTACGPGNINRCENESVGIASAFEGIGNATGISAALRNDIGARNLPQRKESVDALKSRPQGDVAQRLASNRTNSIRKYPGLMNPSSQLDTGGASLHVSPDA